MEGQQGQQGARGGQAIVAYISEQLAAGYSEAGLRQHLMAHGWSDTAISDAFDQYHQSVMPKPTPIAAVSRRYRPRIPKWTRARFLKLGVGFAALLLLASGAFLFWPHHQPQQAAARVSLAYKQKQSRDIVLLAGVISRFVEENNDMVPTRIATTDTGSLILCDAVCSSQTPDFSQLTSYKADNVHFIPYASGLTAPDKDTMYIVSGGTCASATELGEQNVNPRAMVILYARLEDSGKLAQRCVTL